jgi:hypothetical protein
MTKLGTTAFLRGFLATVFLTFSPTDSAAVPSAAFFARGLRTVFFAGAASVASASAFFLRPRLGFSAAGASAIVSAETASTAFSTAGVTSSFFFLGMLIDPPVHLRFSLVYEKNVVKTKRNVKILNLSNLRERNEKTLTTNLITMDQLHCEGLFNIKGDV